jgi:hypothetical protein
MPDAPLPPDAQARESDPADRSAPGVESGTIVLGPDISGDGASYQAPRSRDVVNGAANGTSSGTPLLATQPYVLSSETENDPHQPMLDLRFPDQTSGPGEARADEAMDAAALQGGESGAPRSPESPSNRPQHADAEDPRTAEIQVEISPIFSALDAAERAAEAAQRATPPQIDAFEVGVLLPGPLDAADRTTDTSAEVLPQEPDPPAGAHESVQHADAGSAGTPEASPDAAAHELGDHSSEADHSSEEGGQPHPAELFHDAATRIAVEASATAMALENLKRLLAHKLPEPAVAPPPEPQEESTERAQPPPIRAYEPAMHRPVSPPLMVPAAEPPALQFTGEDEPPRTIALALGGFFAGFALSCVLGVVLYVLLTAG